MIQTLLAAASLWLFALAPMPIGIWQPGEPVMVGLLAAAGGGALLRWRWSPALWSVAPLVVLTLLMMPAQSFPMRSWLGTPELGIGGAWFAALAILSAAFLSVDLAVGGLAAVGAAVAIVAVLLIAPTALMSLNDWTAFVGFAIAAEGSVIALATAAALIAMSGSKGAVVLAAAAGALWLVPWTLPRWLRVTLALACPLAMTAAALVLPFPSLRSRALLWLAVPAAMDGDPWLALHGIGWGGFNDLLLRVLPQLAAADPNWEGLGGGAFHSHSMYVEAMSALGLPGLVAALAMVAVPAWYCEDRRALAAWLGIAGLSAIWFPLPQCVPFLAYALARTAAVRE